MAPVASDLHECERRLGTGGWIWTVYLTPFVVTACFIARFGVNVPMNDEWGIPFLFRSIWEGRHGVSEQFWASNNEHRIVVPKLICAGLAICKSYNVKSHMFISLRCVGITYAGMVRFARRRLRQ